MRMTRRDGPRCTVDEVDGGQRHLAGRLARARAWLAGLPSAALAVVLGASTTVEALAAVDHHTRWAIVLVPGFALAVAYRKRYPVTAAVAFATLIAVETAIGVDNQQFFSGFIGVNLLAFGIGRRAPRRAAVAGLALQVAVMDVAVGLRPGVALADLAFAALVLSAFWLFGVTLAAQSVMASQLAARADLVEAQAGQAALDAVERERRRIARELHDSIAHAITLMVVQAGAAEAVLGEAPPRVRAALAGVQTTGRAALDDMKRLLGVLRSDGPDGLEPQPGLSDLGPLVARYREAGVLVNLTASDTLDAVPASVSTTAYQIVREALTNVLRHSGPVPATVQVVCAPGELVIGVVNDGPQVTGQGGGFGLIGMRERALAFGGQLTAGPRPGGGFAVEARLPVAGPVRR